MTTRSPIQFTLRGTIVLVVAFSLLAALWRWQPLTVREPRLVSLALALVLAALVAATLVYGRGYQRAFAIGAVFPIGLLLLSAVPFVEFIPARDDEFRYFFVNDVSLPPMDHRRAVLIIAASFVTGGVSVATRWFFGRSVDQ